jgi:sterol desaturase/sphingolipid hydroxylase (fatty acid hydroxylase superfamily)
VSVWNEAFRQALEQCPYVTVWILLCAGVFFALAIAVKGLDGALKGARAAAEETRINAILSGVDQFTVAPLMQVITVFAGMTVHGWAGRLGGWPNLALVWAAIGAAPTLLATVFIGDFIGYWRHRAQHSRWLWPAHAIHHSDTVLTWFSLERMHPIDRVGSLFDSLLLSALGFPAWAVLANVLVRHFYGYLIHADVPWTLGKASLILNSPAMHRWHHVRDPEISGKNFATVFSVFDRAFGTFHQPGPCDAPLGLDDDMGRGAIGQYLYPLKVWFGRGKAPARETPQAAAARRSAAPS